MSKGFFRNTTALLFLFASLTCSAAPLAIPPADRAGAINPEEQRDSLLNLLHSRDPFEVPPVYQRPLGEEEGPRIHVTHFVVTGVVDHPKQGITQTSVDALVERLRRQLQTLDSLNEEGFTPDEMKSIGEMMHRALVAGDEQAKAEYEQFVAKLREEKRYKEEMSIGQLQEVANEVTNFYRRSGLIVAQAYVPAQTVKDGVVTIHVMDGILGKILFDGNHAYSDQRLGMPFRPLVNRAVTKSELEGALLRMTDYPGLTAYGVLQPGSEVGQTDLLIKTYSEKNNGFLVRADNHGSASTGEYRLRLGYDRYNVFGRADDFNLNLISTFHPQNTLYGGFKYQTPIINERLATGIGANRNQFDVGGEYADFQISGTVTTANIFVRDNHIRSRSKDFYSQLEFARKSAITKLMDQVISRDILSVVTLEFGGDLFDKRFSSINQATIQLSHGIPGLFGSLESGTDTSSRHGGSGAVADGEFNKVVVNYSRLQSISKLQNVLFRLSGQYSKDLLLPTEQFGLGGPNNVRAYAVSQYLRDSAWTGSFDWNFNAPGFQDVRAFSGRTWGEIFQVSIFGDYATGTLNDPLTSEDNRVSLAGVGVGTQLLIPGQVLARLEIAKPTTSIEPSNNRSPQYYFQLQYTF